jgi:NAD(P)-dependent dehydrogenase (short-subunit alcohol dehydrogenase family)
MAAHVETRDAHGGDADLVSDARGTRFANYRSGVESRGFRFVNVLITGGAGFIGSHLSDGLLARGHRVRALDLLSSEVHGEDCERPEYLNADVELIRGDVRDGPTLRRALDGVEVVYHFAAAVGVGPSMRELGHYTSTNSLGTAALLQELVARLVGRLIVAGDVRHCFADITLAGPRIRASSDAGRRADRARGVAVGPGRGRPGHRWDRALPSRGLAV